jgi:hypothetical protein
MKVFLALAAIAIGVFARADIVVGPIVNPGNGHTYYLLSQNTWSNAEAQAVSLGGHLATIRNAEEGHWVYSTFSGYGGALWIGLTDRAKAFVFTWVSGEPVSYANWSGGQPDNGTGGSEFYVHLWPRDHTHPGQWNDYAGGVDTVLGFPIYGVAEIPPNATARPSLSSGDSGAVAAPAAAATASPELRAFTAIGIELTWASETNRLYQVQRTISMEPPRWESVGTPVRGDGTVLSVFDSTKQHSRAFYRVWVVQ